MDAKANCGERTIERFLSHYAEALTTGNLAAVTGSWEMPAIVLSDEEVLHISTPEEIERFFAGAIEWYRSEDMVSARPELEHLEPISDRLVSLDVRWSTVDGSGAEDAAERCRYIVRVGDDGVPRIRVALIKRDGRAEA